MESPSNSNFWGGNGDRIRFAEDQFPSINQQNLQMEPVRQESGYSEQFVRDLILSNPASEQNLLVNNPTAAEMESMTQQQPEPGQPQHADISPADSHSIINCIPENSARDPRAKKREADRRYRQKKKAKLESLEHESVLVTQKFQTQSKELDNWKKKYEKQHENEQQMKSTLETLKAENESLKNKSVLVTQKFQTQSEELDNWKKKYKKQHENEQQMKSTLETLQTKIESLNQESVSATQKFQTQSKELDNWKKKYEKQHETEQQMQSTFETLKAEIESLRKSVSAMHKFQTQSEELDNWKKKYEKQHENEQWMKSKLKKIEAEKECLSKENFSVNQKFETQSKELDKWKKEYENQLVKKRQLKSKQKTLESENGRLKDQIIETQSKVLVQFGNELSAPKQVASKKSFSHRRSMAGSSRNLIGGLGQLPNLETAGSRHSSQATALPSRASPLPVPRVGSSPATIVLPSPPALSSVDYSPQPTAFSLDKTFSTSERRQPLEPCLLDQLFKEGTKDNS